MIQNVFICLIVVFFGCPKNTKEGNNPVQMIDFQNGNWVEVTENGDVTFGDLENEWFLESAVVYTDTYFENSESWGSFIKIPYGCGNPCWGTIILNVESGKIINRPFDFHVDTTSNRIVYSNLISENKHSLIVLNFEKGDSQIIPIEIRPLPYSQYQIDSIKSFDDKLLLRYRVGEEDNLDKFKKINLKDTIISLEI